MNEITFFIILFCQHLLQNLKNFSLIFQITYQKFRILVSHYIE
jgi:hypothetical protein